MTALFVLVAWCCYLAWIATSKPERVQSHLLWLWALMALGVLLEFIPLLTR